MANSSNQSAFTAINQITFAGSSVLAIPMVARIWMYLISNCASIICSMFVLYYLLFDRVLRSALNNHVIIIILICNFIAEFTTVPWLIYRMSFGVSLVQLPFFCQLWQFIDTTSYTGTPKLIAWASIERHILIFHEQWLLTLKNRILLHYVPILIVCLYHCLLYFVLYFILPCNNTFDYTKNFCGYSSCAYETAYSIYELFSNGILSSLCMLIFSIALAIRVVYQKYRIHHHVNWRRHRKLAIQLFSVVSIFYCFYLPLVLLAIIRCFSASKSLGSQYYVYGSFLSYYINFLLPFVCIGMVPQVKVRVKSIFLSCKRRKTSILPLPVTGRVNIIEKNATIGAQNGSKFLTRVTNKPN